MLNIPGNATTTEVLSVGEVINSAITAAGDADWFRVSMTAGLSYGFRVAGNGGPGIALPDPDMFIYDANGISVGGSSNGSSSSLSVSFLAPTTSANYYIGIFDAIFDDVGSYTLSWVATDNVFNTTATTNTLVANVAFTSKIDVEGDSDWFKVNLTAGLSYGFQVGSAGVNGLPDGDLFLRDANGNTVVSATNGSRSLNTLVTLAQTSGTYFIDVSDSVFSDIGGYTIKWIATDTVFDNVATTASLARNTQVSSKIDVEGDSDWYAVTMTEGISYALEVGSTGIGGLPDGDLILRDVNGNIVATKSNGSYSSNTLSFTALTSGTYFIDVSDNGFSDTGNYILKNVGLDSVLATTNTTRILLDGQKTTGRIDGLGDSDWHKFSAEQGVNYTFTLAGTGVAGELASVYLVLRDALGNVITTALGAVGTITFTASVDGPLYLDVQGYDGRYAGQFSLSVISSSPTINGTSGNDIITGGAEATVINGGAGNDILNGADGNDKLYGSTGLDKLLGGAGADQLFGGAGNDALSGGAGNDRLEGQDGNDLLRGGLGNDQFVFRTTSNTDTILDFQDGADKIRILGGPSSIAGLAISQSGDDVLVKFGAVTIHIDNLLRSDLSAADFLFI